MKLNNIIRQALYEEDEEQKDVMKIFYTTDIFIRRTEAQKDATREEEEAEEEPEEEPEEQPEEGEEEQEESVKETKEVLNEETFRTKIKDGEMDVDPSEAQTILTLDDLLAYVNEQRDPITGKEIINDLVIQIIQAKISNLPPEEIKELIYKSDMIVATIDYGFSKANSIGLNLNKKSGVEESSLSMRQNGEISAAPFNPKNFETTIKTILLPELKKK